MKMAMRLIFMAIQQGFVGINIYASWFIPYTGAAEDLMATQRAIDFFIGWFMHPLVFGDYPETMKKNAGVRIPALSKNQSKLVKGSFDFVGLNHYYLIYVKDNSSSLELENRDLDLDMASTFIYKPGDTPPDELAVTPFGLFAVLEYFKEAYGNPPIYIHENGQRTKRNTTLHDTSRVKYLHAYIGAVLDAIRNGSNARGYMLWSLLDGFELLDGYESSYGLYYVDLDDEKLRRYPKLSAQWYSSFLKVESIKINEMRAAEISRFAPSKPKASEK